MPRSLLGRLTLAVLGLALLPRPVLAGANEHALLHQLLAEKRPDGSKITRYLVRHFPEVQRNSAQSAHVVEGFTIGRHHERVLETYLRQRRHFPLERLAGSSGVDVAKTFKLVLALHDIGKHVERSQAIPDRQPTLRILSDVMARSGFSAGEARLARALISHDLIGDLARKRISVDEAFAALSCKASDAGMGARDFFRLQLFFNTVDGGSYPWLASHAFSRKHGELLPTSPAIRALAERFGAPVE
jgi:hypothetical protein